VHIIDQFEVIMLAVVAQADNHAPGEHLDPLLLTKLLPPPAGAAPIVRPQLIDHLEHGAAASLTLLVAPAGYGKTTLMSDWVRCQDRPVGWLSLESADNDPVRFWSYVVAALRAAIPGVGAAALGLLQADLARLDAALSALLNDLAEVGGSVVLALDDYHLIDNPHIHAAMTFVLDHLPPNLRLLIAARGRPPFSLGRLRARGHLVELDAAALRFSPVEAATFLQNTMGISLGAGDVAALMARTEGWPAGLRLAALALHGQTDIAAVMRAFQGDHYLVADYLIDEILCRQPSPIQTFLLRTSILDRLSAPLCAALLEEQAGAAAHTSQLMLEHLERANLFLTPLDAGRSWFRYHQLFADALRAQLRQRYPEQVAVLHRRAAAWLVSYGLPSDAVEHALAASDHGFAAQLIAQLADDLWLRGEMATLQRWLIALPHAAIAACPTLAVMHTLMLFQAGQVQQADLAVQRLTCQWSAADNAPNDRAAFLALLRTIQALAQGTALPPLPPLPCDLSTWSAIVALNLGMTYWMHGVVKQASVALASAETHSRAYGHADVAFLAAAYQADSLAQMSQLDQAAERYQQLLSQMRSCQSALAPMASHALLGLGQICYEWNDLDAATQLLNEATALARHGGKNDVVLDSLLSQARITLARGDTTGAQSLLEEALHLARGWNIGVYIGRVGAQQARLWLTQGDVAAATRWARGRGLGSDDSINALVERDYLMLSRLRIAQGCIDEALLLLERIACAAERDGRGGRVIETLVVTTLAYLARADVECAFETLVAALILAEPGGYIRTFVDEGAPIAELLRATRMRGVVPDYVADLLAAFDAESALKDCDFTVRSLPSDIPALTQTREQLTTRELELLRCLAAGLANGTIAARLGLSPNTVRWYLRNLYSKLGVHSRTQAIAHGRALGVLD
jgi:LuxR family transcriptional regulator, maltose regulon positive regulatory protein